MTLALDTFVHTVTTSTRDTQAHLVLTANQRQSRFLKKHIIDNTDLQHQHGAKPSQNIMPLTSWVSALWFALQDQGVEACQYRLLSKLESLALWEQVLSQQAELPALVDRAKLVQQLYDAADTCALFQLPITQLQQSGFAETQFYLTLKTQFDHLCARLRVCTYARAVTTLITHANKHGLTRYQHIYLYGFAEVSPALTTLAQLFSKNDLETIDTPRHNVQRQFITEPNSKDELQAAAHWAKHMLDTTPPNTRIAVVVPDLANQLASVQQVFAKTLEPARFLHQTDTFIPSVYDISASQPLNKTLLANTALNLLALFDKKLPIAQAESLLLSEYWGAGFNAERMQILTLLRRQNQVHINSAYLVSLIEKLCTDKTRAEQHPSSAIQPGPAQATTDDEAHIRQAGNQHNAPPIEAKTDGACLAAVRQMLSSSRERKAHTAWVGWYLECLKNSGWPGSRTLSSFEYQCAQAFISMLQALAKLDGVNDRPVSLFEFKHSLGLFCANTPGQAEVKSPRIRIMGLMEAAGLSFDHCYIINLTDKTLPETPRPHPFIPVDLQREYNAPKSSPERELHYSKQLLRSLVDAAKSVHLSYAREHNGAAQTYSPLLNALRPTTAAANGDPIDTDNRLPPSTVFQRHINAAKHFAAFDQVSLGRAPEIKPGESIRGGAYHLSAFAINPLFAFFKYRLAITDIPTSSLGLNFIERGTLVHDGLAQLYALYPTREQLITLRADPECNNTLNSLAQRCFRSTIKRAAIIPDSIVHYEIQRLTDSLEHCIDLDCARAQDFTVAHIESKHSIHVHQRLLNVRVDRIDKINSDQQTHANKLCVIDYKTGDASLTPLIKNQVDDFQLPLYCYGRETRTAAASYVCVSENGAHFKGLGDTEQVTIDGIVKGHSLRNSSLTDNWQETLSRWHHDVDTTTIELCGGQANYQVRNSSKQIYFNYLSSAVRPEEREHNT